MSFLALFVAFWVVVLAAILGWYLLIKTEGVYLGWRVVVWLYDVYASRYDRIKGYDSAYETFFLARPIIRRLQGVPRPLILDAATGTGRLPLILLEQWDFLGHVIGLDLSRRMLFQAAVKLARRAGSCDLVWYTVAALPFPEATFDMVTCIEAWEFFPHPREDLRELVRVLRPGGWLLITNRRGPGARLMPGKTLTTDRLRQTLEDEFGLIDVEHSPWQVDYELFWARKPGSSAPAGARPLAEILRCPSCGRVGLISRGTGERVCASCQCRVPVGADGVIELFRWTRGEPD